MMHREQFEYINGHSNWYWGWGYEDHDMARRLRSNPARNYEKHEFYHNDFYEQVVADIQGWLERLWCEGLFNYLKIRSSAL